MKKKWGKRVILKLKAILSGLLLLKAADFYVRCVKYNYAIISLRHKQK